MLPKRIFTACLLLLTAATTQVLATDIIAHRGYWKAEGAAQNSRASLQNALDLGCYGSEIDIWLTTDGHLMVNHDASFQGVTIQDSTYDQCRNLTLANGEQMPLLDDLLQMLKDSDSPTKLIIEIKEHATLLRNEAAASLTIKKVREYGLEDRVEYITFSHGAGLQVVKEAPDAKIAYLTGNIAPAVLKQEGFTGIDYERNVLLSHPEWIEEAHANGMTVNVWTPNKTNEFARFIEMGVDYITTDQPVEALQTKQGKAAK